MRETKQFDNENGWTAYWNFVKSTYGSRLIETFDLGEYRGVSIRVFTITYDFVEVDVFWLIKPAEFKYTYFDAIQPSIDDIRSFAK